MVPAPGDPWYSTYTKDPLKAPVTGPPQAVAAVPPLGDSMPGLVPAPGAASATPSADPASATQPAAPPTVAVAPPDGGGN